VFVTSKGRTKVFGWESEAGARIRKRQEEKDFINAEVIPEKDTVSSPDEKTANVGVLPR